MDERVSTAADADRRRGSHGLRRFFPGTLFVASYFVALGSIEYTASGSLLALAGALLPVPFFAWLLIDIIRGVRGMDELERRIQLEALAVAFPCALLIVFTAGLLDRAGFHGTNDWDPPRLLPFVVVPYFAGLALARRRYQ